MIQISHILIPLIRSEIPQLISGLEEMLLPRIRKTAIFISLDDIWRAEEKILIQSAHTKNVHINTSTSVNFISCKIPAEQSIYLRNHVYSFNTTRWPYGVKSGPNLQFFRSIRYFLANRRKDAVLLLETDTIPLHDLWLEKIEEEINRIDDFFVAGSKYKGSAQLPEAIKNHINGNAVYHVEAQGFAEFFDTWEQTLLHCIPKEPTLAYDVVWDWSIFNQVAFDFISIAKFTAIYNSKLRSIDSIVNISAPDDAELDISYYVSQTSQASLLHAKPALAFRHQLIGNRALDLSKFTQNNTVFAYDAQWQFPAITEQFAFQRINAFSPDIQGVKYFAFPWATLIDLRTHKENSQEVMRLMAALYHLKRQIGSADRIITVCQHISALDFQWLFNEVGITDLFWSHAKIDENFCPFFDHIKIHPFPLYPVQAMPASEAVVEGTRHTLFSFVGARAKWVNPEGKGQYLTHARNWIIDKLSHHRDGKIISRESWYYESIVYKQQIGVAYTVEDPSPQASVEFITILRDSVFSLCPSGTGPNSIRLWESIGMGAIPVILADTYLPPGNKALWEEAAVFCPETLEAIEALPDRLIKLAEDQTLLTRKRHALKQLWKLYGPGCFIYDIQKLMTELTSKHQRTDIPKSPVAFDGLSTIAQKVKTDQLMSKEELSTFLISCSSKTMADPDGFITLYQQDEQFRATYHLAMQLGEPKHVEMMQRVLQQKKLSYILRDD